MKYLTLILALGACSLFQKEEDKPVDNKPLRDCVQQKEPKDPSIPCKIGDWYFPGDAKCSSTQEKCQRK
jgi:hypothetical protein